MLSYNLLMIRQNNKLHYNYNYIIYVEIIIISKYNEVSINVYFRGKNEFKESD